VFVNSPQDISQRDLRMRSKEIMDAVERGQTFTVTRDGRGIAELIPLRAGRRFVAAADFVALGRGLPRVDAAAFRADIDATIDPFGDDPFTR
jgi:prevent-host-death family protein